MRKHDVKEIVEKLSPKFSKNIGDVWELLEKADSPVVMAALLYKLSEEREKANRELDKVNEKFDRIMLELKTGNSFQAAQDREKNFSILPEQDQKILDFVERNGPATAGRIQGLLQYKNPNAASQRLNALYRQGLLKKVQSGKKVSYFSP